MPLKLLHMSENSLNQSPRGSWFVQSNVVRDGIQIAQGRFRPNQRSDLPILLFASS